MQEAETKENLEKNSSPNLNENSQRNSRVRDEEQRWTTVTRDSYPIPRSDISKSSGRRRELMKNFIRLRVFGETTKAIVADPPPRSISPSEYVDNFCNFKFIPFMDRAEYDAWKHIKYPLYGGAAAQTYYKCQLDRGTLKTGSEIQNLNEPFRKSCSFTTPLDLAFREPTGGF